MINGTGVTARYRITCSTTGEGGKGSDDDSGCGAGERGDTGAVWRSTGLGCEIASTTSCSLDICISTSVVSQASSLLNNAEAGGHFAITTLTAGGGGAVTASTGAGGSDGGGAVLGIETGVGGRSVGTSKLDDESETIGVDDVGVGSTKDNDDVTIDTSSESLIVDGGESSRVSTAPAGAAGVIRSSISIHAGSSSEDGVGDTSLAGNISLKEIHLSAAEGDTEEGSSFAWAVTLPGICEEASRGGCCCNAGELDTGNAITHERSERPANLERGDMEGTANAGCR